MTVPFVLGIDKAGFFLYIKCTNSVNTLKDKRIPALIQAGGCFAQCRTGKEDTMIIIDYSDKRPIYEQIIDRVETLIVTGVLEPDEKLPSVRSLAVELSINPNTIQRAYMELEREGFIYSVKGRGNFVRADAGLKEKQQKKSLDELSRQMKVCRELGIEKEKLLKCVDIVYEEVAEL